MAFGSSSGRSGSVRGAAGRSRSAKGTVNPAGIIRGSGGKRAKTASPSAKKRITGKGTSRGSGRSR